MVCYSPSWKVFSRNIKLQLPQNPSVACFSYGNGELPQSEKAINEMSKYYGRNFNVFQKNQCTKKVFLRQIPQYDLLHIAMHAQSNPFNRHDNKIYFLTDAQDGYEFLYGYELFPLRLNAKLVVLPSCQTSSGKIETGEGMYSLSRIFLQMGVPRVVSTFWSVDNGPTSELMKYFYAQLNQHPDPAEALHEAKKQYLKEYYSELTHPSFWAGVICMQ
jgi:CHAT domain-containing protein